MRKKTKKWIEAKIKEILEENKIRIKELPKSKVSQEQKSIQKQKYLVISKPINDVGSYINIVAEANNNEGKYFRIFVKATYGITLYEVLDNIMDLRDGILWKNNVQKEFKPHLEEATLIEYGVGVDELKKRMDYFMEITPCIWNTYKNFNSIQVPIPVEHQLEETNEVDENSNTTDDSVDEENDTEEIENDTTDDSVDEKNDTEEIENNATDDSALNESNK